MLLFKKTKFGSINLLKLNYNFNLADIFINSKYKY